MKLCRFTHMRSPSPQYGMIEGEFIRPLLDADQLGSRPRATTEKILFAEARLLAPTVPSKIVCIGRNFKEHAKELGNEMPATPLIFLKASSAIIATNDVIEIPPESVQVEHEGELGVVIGRTARRISDVDDPLSYVLGFTCVNDVTARDIQRSEGRFTRAKSFDTFCPVGPCTVTDINPLDVLVETRVNGVTRQSGRTSSMAFPVPFLIKYISRAMTLNPGDIISTGTPSGVSKLNPGDIVEVEVEGIGVLRNSVIAMAEVSSQ